jgi:hypothetical protein
MIRSNSISRFAQLGLICGGGASVMQAVINQQSAPMVLLAAAIGSAVGAGIGALYGYIKLRRAR